MGTGELDRDMMYGCNGRQSDHLELGSWNRGGKLNIASEAEAAGAASSRGWRRYQTRERDPFILRISRGRGK